MKEPHTVHTAYATFDQGDPTRGPRVKQGHNCCGGCCDVRRAVIIVDLISVCSVAFALAMLVFLDAVAGKIDMNEITDDAVRADFEEQLSMLEKYSGITSVILIVEMVFYGMGVYGAISYNQWLVASALVLYSVLVAYNAAYFNIPGVIGNALFAYPHWFLIQEIRSGIMTKENYPNEKHSCCCV
jgi:hypothetical protein